MNTTRDRIPPLLISLALGLLITGEIYRPINHQPLITQLGIAALVAYGCYAFMAWRERRAMARKFDAALKKAMDRMKLS